jgi:CubicO group peptidase (beta-lactamase class C family)
VVSDGAISTHGPVDHVFALASVTKMLVAFATLIAVEEGSIALDDPAGPEGSTVRHLLAHASGLGPDGAVPLARPGARRIYSNAGFEVLGATLAAATGIATTEYVHEAVCMPLGMDSTRLEGSPASGAMSTVRDLAAFASELLTPALVSRATLISASRVAFAGVDGVLPGFGQQSPNDWGLGFEVRDAKHPHWTGTTNSAATFGHFGQTGTMLWIDPVAHVGLVCLTDRPFGPWAAAAWPELSDAVVAHASAR